MSITVSVEELLAYSDQERRKWREWVAADPSRLQIPVQPGGRFATVGAMLDHVFLVERRHLARLEGATAPDATGLAPTDWKGLFEYATLVRADMRRYLADLDAQAGTGALTFSVQSGGVFTMTRRKLLTHMVLHEVRHLAQLALAARIAGQEPPGQHDLFYFAEFA
jgi:uncharacterized damage-inducible protein DinB